MVSDTSDTSDTEVWYRLSLSPEHTGDIPISGIIEVYGMRALSFIQGNDSVTLVQCTDCQLGDLMELFHSNGIVLSPEPALASDDTVAEAQKQVWLTRISLVRAYLIGTGAFASLQWFNQHARDYSDPLVQQFIFEQWSMLIHLEAVTLKKVTCQMIFRNLAKINA